MALRGHQVINRARLHDSRRVPDVAGAAVRNDHGQADPSRPDLLQERDAVGRS
jgi:hypothetical protein